MMDKNVEILTKIAPAKILKDVQHFLVFANFHRRFIKDYSKIILPMTNSTFTEKQEWQSTPEIEQAQTQLVQAFITAPVLRQFDPEEPAIGETNVDHGSNREPCGSVRKQTEPCSTPTVRFAPRTALRRHSSVHGGYKPPRFATVCQTAMVRVGNKSPRFVWETNRCGS